MRAVPIVPADSRPAGRRLYYDKESGRLVRYEEVNQSSGKVMDTFAYSYEGGKTVARRQWSRRCRPPTTSTRIWSWR